jgi:putative DNA primase/helicase
VTTWVRTPRWLAAVGPAPKSPPLGGPLTVRREHIPLELKAKRAWACWRYEQNGRSWSKPPFNPTTGERAEASISTTWVDFETAYEALVAKGSTFDGVSFALSPLWGLVGIDLDHTSLHLGEMQRIVDLLDTYTEHSPSGDGIRMFVHGHLPPGRRRRDWVEMYSERRFLTVTGHKLANASPTIKTAPRHLHNLWLEYLGPK